jgi:hypothetical protein
LFEPHRATGLDVGIIHHLAGNEEG